MKAATPIALALLFVLGVALFSGCAVDEIITVDVPRDVQKTMSVGDRISLREARVLREELVEKNNAAVRKFDREIADGAFAEQLVGSAVNDVLPIAIPAVGNLPGGMILTGLLTALGAWFVPRPGEGKRIKAEHDKTWDEAFAAGKAQS